MHGSGAVSCSCSLLIRGLILPAVRQKLHLSPCADSRSRLSIVLLTAVSASAGPEAEHRGHWVSPGQWQMNDIGRNHGVLGGPGIPKCNPWVSPECARLHPGLFNKVPRPR